MDDTLLFDEIDDIMYGLDLKDLEQIRLNMIRDNQSTEIIDKVIQSKKEEQKQQDKESKELGRMFRNAAISGVLSGLGEGLSNINTSEDYLMPDERNIVNNSDYEDYNFEEDSEEDDYYYEDE